ncbi:hypothetical protein ABGB07_29655 [Micromonosporaceae bacterium B7E4]
MLFELRTELPGQWSVRGTGLGTVLAREPLGWSLCWIGYAGSPSRPVGWLSAGVQPLVTPALGFEMTYGIRMDEVDSGARSVDLLSDDAAGLARRFVLDAGLATIDAWPSGRLADVAERDFAQSPPRRRKYWYQLPGWRAVNGTASPVEPAEQLAELCREQARTASDRGARQLLDRAAFYGRLREAWHEGGSEAALRLLTGQRDQTLAAWRLDRVTTAQPDLGR